jgi:hypothetical protein
VTAGPTLSGARIVIARQDGQPIAIASFTAKLLANTAGAGGAIEVMPMRNGEDGVANPFVYDATGIAGNSFTNNTPELSGFDAYKATLYVDYALMSLTVVDASLPPPFLDILPVNGTTIQLSWPASATGYTLAAATNMPTTAWSTVTNSVVTNGEMLTVQLEATGSRRFFRLQK